MTSRSAVRIAVGRRLLVAGAHAGQALGDAVGGGDQEVARAAGRVDDRQLEDRPLGLLGGRLVGGLVEHRVERRVEQAR